MKKFCEAVKEDDSKAKKTDVALCDSEQLAAATCESLALAVGGASIAPKELKEEAQKGADLAQQAHTERMESVGLTSTTGAAVLAGSAAFALVAAMLQ